MSKNSYSINKLSLLFLISCLCQFFGTYKAHAEADSVVVSDYLETIRNSRSDLYHFFSRMPKGGDLHNHLTGSVYAETYFDLAVKSGCRVDTITGKLYNKTSDSGHVKLDTLKNIHSMKIRLLDLWSIINYNSARSYDPSKSPLPPDEYFFGTFGLFGEVTGDLVTLLAELKLRAIKENQQYLEIMMTSPKFNAKDCSIDTSYNTKLLEAIKNKNANNLFAILADLYQKLESCDIIKNYINNYVSIIDSVDKQTNKLIGKDSSQIKCFYQVYTGRNTAPLTVFTNIYIGIRACLANNSKLVGVNIVQAENGEESMRDYWGHMKMFQFFANPTDVSKKVNFSIHAGELTIGLVKPEDLTSHISDAVRIAGAKRIGHGVDIAFERDSTLFKRMKDSNVVVEINLTSNEFILGVKDDAHPLPLYMKNGVPVVLSTDDAGILRTNHAEQFVLAVERYKGVTYSEIKKMLRNSINYSFAPKNEKDILNKTLEERLQQFEKEMASYINNK